MVLAQNVQFVVYLVRYATTLVLLSLWYSCNDQIVKHHVDPFLDEPYHQLLEDRLGRYIQ